MIVDAAARLPLGLLSDEVLLDELTRRRAARREERAPKRRLEVLTAPPRAECPEERPCPRAPSCRYGLTSEASCALDLAELGGLTLEETAPHFSCTRENIRQIERRALQKLAKRMAELRP